MRRFNFVCHGMMWLVEEEGYIRILIPEIEPHLYRHGQPDRGTEAVPGKPAITDLIAGEIWQMTGVASSGKSLLSLISPSNALVLRGSAFDIRIDLARNQYLVPMPDRIRNYRASESGNDIFGATDPAVAHGVPHVSHDVTCLCYDHTPGAITISNGADKTYTLDDPNKIGVSWCLYAQPKVPEPPHDTGAMNRLLVHKNGSNPDFRLAVAAVSDKAHDVTKGRGLCKTHLMNLLELDSVANSPETDGGAGCHKGFVACP